MPRHTKNRPNKPVTSRPLAYWPAALWAAIILLLTGLPGNNLPDIDFWELNIEDKLAHFFVFGVFAALLVYGKWRRRPDKVNWWKIGWSVLVISAFYGALTEVLQGTVFVSRYASFGDFVANTLGAAIGTTAAVAFLARRQKG